MRSCAQELRLDADLPRRAESGIEMAAQLVMEPGALCSGQLALKSSILCTVVVLPTTVEDL